ncbi:MAG: hypothetical protein CMI55_00970 [Parcubacteria group bacterium]|jgi:RecJ-like exonuclease|nr:hypothetical protein [Parcubacteria group bacterium]|tara:strand:+ start:705 stop:1688 length:984 start_codon:yes stop_codon:yes gene_type:complete
MEMVRRKRICISHKKDVDGIVSAALFKRARDTEVILADYGDIIDHLSQLRRVDELYICDLGLNKSTWPEFYKLIQAIAKHGQVVYTDHHPMENDWRRALKKCGVIVNHSINDCAGVLSYEFLKKELPHDAHLLAAYAAITDYLDGGFLAKKIIQQQDRQFVLLEATLLSYALARRGGDEDYLKKLVSELSNMTPPHRITDVLHDASEQAERMVYLMTVVRKLGSMRKGYASICTEEPVSGLVANLLLGAFQVSAGIAYKLSPKKDTYDISLRGTEDCRCHLGEVASYAADIAGGAGGGHAKASGARIPVEHIEDFLSGVEEKLLETK